MRGRILAMAPAALDERAAAQKSGSQGTSLQLARNHLI